MSILLMENFSFGEGFKKTGTAGTTTERLDPDFLKPLGVRTVRYQYNASYGSCYGTIDFAKVEMERDGEAVERPSVFFGGSSSAAVNNYRYTAGMYIPFPKTKTADSTLWFGMRLMQRVPEGDYTASSDSPKNVRLGVSLWNDFSSITAIRAARRVLTLGPSNYFELDRKEESVEGAGTAIFPKNVPGKPFFLDIEYNRATGDIRVWIDNIFCGTIEKYYWSNNPANRATYLLLGVDDAAYKRTGTNGFYITDLLIAENDGEGWCDRFGPDMWVESHTPTTDTINQWSRPAEYTSNHDVVAKSSFTALDTSAAGNQDYLHATAADVVDAYSGDVFLKDNILGISTQSVMMNAGSAIHAVAPVFVTGENAAEDEEVIITQGTSLPYAFRTLTTVNPATGEPFTKDEIEALSFGLKVKY